MGGFFSLFSLFWTIGIHIQVVKIRDGINPPGVYMDHSVIFFVLWCRHVVYDDCTLTFAIPGMRTWDTKKFSNHYVACETCMNRKIDCANPHLRSTQHHSKKKKGKE